MLQRHMTPRASQLSKPPGHSAEEQKRLIYEILNAGDPSDIAQLRAILAHYEHELDPQVREALSKALKTSRRRLRQIL